MLIWFLIGEKLLLWVLVLEHLLILLSFSGPLDLCFHDVIECGNRLFILEHSRAASGHRSFESARNLERTSFFSR